MLGISVTYGEVNCDDEAYVAVFAKKLAEKFSQYTILRYDGVNDLDESMPIKEFIQGKLIHEGVEKGLMSVI